MHLVGILFPHRWDDNIKLDIEEIEWCVDIDWIGLAEDRDKWRAVVRTVMNFGFCNVWGICVQLRIPTDALRFTSAILLYCAHRYVSPIM